MGASAGASVMDKLRIGLVEIGLVDIGLVDIGLVDIGPDHHRGKDEEDTGKSIDRMHSVGICLQRA